MRTEPGITPVYQAVMSSPLPGKPYLGLRIIDGRLAAIDFLWHKATPVCEEKDRAVCARLSHYFGGRPQPPVAPLQPCGTSFRQRVWQRLQRIPPGEVMTYGALAYELGSSPRAVAGACRDNPIPILIPCHRVVAAKGAGGYMGKTAGRALAIKLWLLQHEGYV